MQQPQQLSTSAPPQFPIYHSSTEDFSESETAGFNVRFLALVIDILILKMIQNAFAFLLQGLYLHMGATSLALMAGTMVLVYLAVITYYFVWPTAEWGQTLGKMLMGIKVVGTPGTPPQLTLARAAKRELLGKFFSAAIFGYGFLLAAARPNGMALHDNFAHTRVVKL